MSEEYRPPKPSMNNQDAKLLAAIIKRKSVQSKDVKVGDIVIDDFNVWEVTKIEIGDVPPEYRVYEIWAKAEHAITILDQDDNGPINPDSCMVTIIDRSCIDKSHWGRASGLYDVV